MPAVIGPTVFHYRQTQGAVREGMKSIGVSREKDPMTEESITVQSRGDLPEILVNYVQHGGQFYIDGKKITKHKKNTPEDLEVRMVLLNQESEEVNISTFSKSIPSTPALPDSLLERLVSEGRLQTFEDTLTIDTENDLSGGRKAITEHLAALVCNQSKIEVNPLQKDIYFGSALVTDMRFLSDDDNHNISKNLHQGYQKQIAIRYVVNSRKK